MSQNTHEVEDAEAIAETELALLVSAADLEDHYKPGKNGVWIPKSAIHEDSDVYEEGHTGTLVVQAWFARKEGW